MMPRRHVSYLIEWYRCYHGVVDHVWGVMEAYVEMQNRVQERGDRYVPDLHLFTGFGDLRGIAYE